MFNNAYKAALQKSEVRFKTDKPEATGMRKTYCRWHKEVTLTGTLDIALPDTR